MNSTHSQRWNGKLNNCVQLTIFLYKERDIRSIGQFGVGLKYWFHHFKRFELSYYGNDFRHTLSIHRTHNPKFCSTLVDNEDENLLATLDLVS